MTKFKSILESHFGGIQCSTHDDTSKLVDKNNGNCYKVKFGYIGVCVLDFDTVSAGALGNRKCFDVLSLNDKKIKYIELKSSITNNNIKELGNKFYFGHIKAQAIIAPLPIKDCSYEYIVIYTKDVFSKNKPREDLQKKAENHNKDYIKAWENNTVFLEFKHPEIDPFKTGVISIQKYLYGNSSSIHLN